jgi:predicted PhzF superfamily epimerase YddE/YHI9
MKLPVYIVDAFTDKLLEEIQRQSALCMNGYRIELMQDLAAENNLSETAFIIEEDDHYRIRWFHAFHRSKALRSMLHWRVPIFFIQS